MWIFNETAQEESPARKWTGRFFEGIKGGSSMQTRFKVLNSKKLSKETVAGIQDMTMGKIRNGYRSGKATIRFDTGKNTGTNPHINIDPRGYPSRKNLHIAVPEGVVNGAKVLNSTLNYIGIALTIASVTIESWRIGCAIRDDIFVNKHADDIIQELEFSRKKLKKTFEPENNWEKILKDTKRAKKAPVKTIRTVASAAGGWGGGFVAGAGGAWAGAGTGAMIGSLFGPVGVTVFAPIGAVVGAIGLGIGGGVVGSSLGENAAEAGLTLLDD